MKTLTELTHMLLDHDPTLDSLNITEVIHKALKQNHGNYNDKLWRNFCTALGQSKTIKKMFFGSQYIVTLGLVNLEQCEILFEAIQINNTLTKIFLIDSYLYEMPRDVFKSLIKAFIESKTIQDFYFDCDFELDNEQWEGLLDLAKNKKISIVFKKNWHVGMENDLWEENRFPALMKFGKITHLNFNNCDFGEIMQEHSILEMIAKAPVLEKLEIENADLQCFSYEDMKSLCDSIETNKSLVELNIGCNGLSKWRKSNFLILCDYIRKNATLTSLIFRKGHFDHLVAVKIEENDNLIVPKDEEFISLGQYFFDSIAQNKSLKILDLSKEKMNKWTPDFIIYSFRAIFKSNIHSLILSQCNLNELPKTLWQALCLVLTENKNVASKLNHKNEKKRAGFLTYLNLSDNDLGGQTDYDIWVEFCDALSNQPLEKLDLQSNYLFASDYLDLLHNAVKSCELLTDLNMSDNDLKPATYSQFTSIIVSNTKGILFAAAQSLRAVPYGNSNTQVSSGHKKVCKEKHSNKKIPELPNDCIKHILSFLPAYRQNDAHVKASIPVKPKEKRHVALLKSVILSLKSKKF